MRKLENKIGETFTTTSGLTVEIIEFNSIRDCSVRFEDGTILRHREYRDLKRGNLKNPNQISVCGVGYIGEELPINFDILSRRSIYLLWKNILYRCYDKRSWTHHPTYQECSVVKEWFNFQNFAKWVIENYKTGYELDKDILVRNNKIYGPDTCCFVPMEINTALPNHKSTRGKYPLGVTKCNNYFLSKISRNGKATSLSTFNTIEKAFNCYKTAKEIQLKELANKFKTQITNEVCQALLNYEVKITD